MNPTPDLRFRPQALEPLAHAFLSAMGSTDGVAAEVAAHLVDADLKGVKSHRVVRLPAYLRESRDGDFDPASEPEATTNDHGVVIVRGNRGFGIPAMRLAVEKGIAVAKNTGMAVTGVHDCAHTGRVGAYVERAAEAGVHRRRGTGRARTTPCGRIPARRRPIAGGNLG